MKRTLVIGSTTVDIIIHVDHLPNSTDDVNVSNFHTQLGGCAYNVSCMLHLFDVPYTLCTPLGTGIYADFTEKELAKKGVTLQIHSDEPSSACLCLVEPSGERSFVAYHGAEYGFSREKMKAIDLTDVDSAYICGLEVEDFAGEEIVEYLKEHPEFTIYFAPGPRLLSIDTTRLHTLLSLSPIVHLNEQEILSFTKASTVQEACEALFDLTHNDIVVTLGPDGCIYYHDGCTQKIEGVKAQVVDTIGAGDSHLGSYISAIHMGYTPEKACALANRVAAKVVSVSGGNLSPEQFKEVQF